MSTTSRRSPFIWVTWVTGLLATDDSCRWAAWFKAHFTFTKVERDDTSLTIWKAEHGDMVSAEAARLFQAGYTVTIEDQNKFTLKGRTSTLMGKPDVLAVSPDETEIRIVDCKSGTRKDKDFWQVAIYLMALPLTRRALCEGKRLVGELVYRDKRIVVQPEEMTPAIRERITAQLLETAGPDWPAKVPSERECAFCDIGKADCPERVELPEPAAMATTDLF